MHTLNLEEIIKELQGINKTCQEVKYSLDTSSRLYYLSDQLKEHAREVYQCCF